MDRKVVYSGIQPTGCITIGNYIGAVNNWIKMQNEYDALFSIVDLHGLTVRQNPAEYRKNALGFFAQLLAVGLDSEKCIMYIQSHVPQHAELAWILNCYTYVGEAGRMTQFKEKSLQHADNINMGLMDYPVLMAADILLFKTDLVPVGIDQKQHLELARDLAIRFNNLYSPAFSVPEPYIPAQGAKIYSLSDPAAKMSKSDPNPYGYVSIIDTPDDIAAKFKRAVTDSDMYVEYSGGKPGIKNLLTIFSAFTGKAPEALADEYRTKGYGALKQAVGEAVIEGLKSVRENYLRLSADKEYIMGIARAGAEKAKYIASRTLAKVHKKIGLVER